MLSTVPSLFGISIYDLYRGVLLSELVLTYTLYWWALIRYLRRSHMITNSALLHGFRVGQAARIGGVMILLLVFILAVISSFGTNSAGRLLYNLLVQFAIGLLLIAWWKIDIPRFRAVPASVVAHNILTAVADDEVVSVSEQPDDKKAQRKQAK